MKPYKHLTREERYSIEQMRKAGYKQNKMAELLERSEGTISRELSRNTGQRGYRSVTWRRTVGPLKSHVPAPCHLSVHAPVRFARDISSMVGQVLGPSEGTTRFRDDVGDASTSTKKDQTHSICR